MRRAAALLTLTVVLLGAGTRSWDPPSASACSCGNECDPSFPHEQIIVEGRIAGWTRLRDNPPGVFTPIAVSIVIERVYRGSVPTAFTMVDGASLMTTQSNGTGLRWAGATGSCGTFDEDPTGLWVIAALRLDDFGRYRMNRLATPFLAREPTGEQYNRLVASLTANVGPPAAGSAGLAAARESGTSWGGRFVLGAVLASAIALSAAWAAWRRRARATPAASRPGG